MPARTRTRKFVPIKSAKGKRALARRKVRMQNTHLLTNAHLGLGFPKKITLTHKYSEIIQVTSTAPTPAVYQISCNSLYDPNATGTGHQPYYMDQLSALYQHYVVLGSKITMRICPTVNTSGCIVTGFINDDTASVSGNPPYTAEYGSGQTRLLTPGFTKPATFVMKWSAAKQFGKAVLANTELQGTPSSNPAEQQYYTFQMTDSSYANNLLFNLYWQIEYIAVWKELKDIAAS